jgi:hypothetical protein
MNRLKLYLVAHGCAADTLDVTAKEDRAAKALEAFKAAGGSSKADFVIFQVYLEDERLKMLGIQTQKLPSEMAAETV